MRDSNNRGVLPKGKGDAGDDGQEKSGRMLDPYEKDR